MPQWGNSLLTVDDEHRSDEAAATSAGDDQPEARNALQSNNNYEESLSVSSSTARRRVRFAGTIARTSTLDAAAKDDASSEIPWDEHSQFEFGETEPFANVCSGGGYPAEGEAQIHFAHFSFQGKSEACTLLRQGIADSWSREEYAGTASKTRGFPNILV